MTHTTRFLLAMLFLAVGREAFPCNVISVARTTTLDYVRMADAIVHVRAQALGQGPHEYDSTGAPTGRIVFEIVNVLQGTGIGASLTLPGFLLLEDNYNPGPVPYSSSRAWGTCYADGYRLDAEFLLLLQRGDSGDYTARWAPLAPLNEQIRGKDDSWLRWVRASLR